MRFLPPHTTSALAAGGVALFSFQKFCANSTGVAHARDGPAQSVSGKSVFSWGSGQFGQTGLGSETMSGGMETPTLIDSLPSGGLIAIAAGGQSSAAVSVSGEVFTWGRGQNGRLGHGSNTHGENLPRLVEQLSNQRVVQISVSEKNMACVTATGEVWTWGVSAMGQLGHGSNGGAPAKVENLDANIVQVAMGRNHCLALSADGVVFGWGGARDGAVGTGAKRGERKPTRLTQGGIGDKQVVQIAAGEDLSAFVTSDGQLYTCGATDYGQIGHGQGGARYQRTPKLVRSLAGRRIVEVACGQFHCLALDSEGIVFSFGLNQDGQLGQGDRYNKATPHQIDQASFLGSVPCQVRAGGGHSAVVCDNGSRLFVFGRGRSGQLGRGAATESVAAGRATPVEVLAFQGQPPVKDVALGSDHSMALV